MGGAFIFDWSGTLSNNFESFYAVVNLMFNELGKEPISKKELRLNFTLPYMKFWNQYFPDLSHEDEFEMYSKFIHQVKDPELYENVEDVIRYLHKNNKLFVVSSDPKSKLKQELDTSNLASYFTEVNGEVHKKNFSITSLLVRYSLNPESTFYVGDTSGDVEYGKTAGVRTVGISWGFQDKSKLKLSEPDYLIDDILELKNIH